jgi:peptidoglycan-associated lipoprotein
MLFKRKWNVIWIALVLVALVAFSSGCKKKAPPPPPPPPAPAPAPPPPPPPAPDIASFSAEPSSIERGQSSTLSWNVTNANQITIDNGVGTVQATGSKSVYPNDTTTYKLTASGAGGTLSKTATVTVSVPPPPPPPAPKPSLGDRLGQLQDAYFDYDKSDIRDDARAALTKDADALKAIFQEFPTASLTLEGHCDERGSAEYNLGLGDRRATAAKDFLVQLGVPADRLKTISYGKERPVCNESNEECWQRNRRAHFAAGQ